MSDRETELQIKITHLEEELNQLKGAFDRQSLELFQLNRRLQQLEQRNQPKSDPKNPWDESGLL